LGTPYPNARQLANEPHRTETNGLYFDGTDFMSMNIVKDSSLATSDILTFSNSFTIEMWIRFTEPTISQDYILYQKIETKGRDTPWFRFYFTAYPEQSFVVELN
jgi:hypothetical protein